MSSVLFLKGGSALSEFRTSLLQHDLSPLGVTQVRAEQRYFVELGGYGSCPSQ